MPARLAAVLLVALAFAGFRLYAVRQRRLTAPRLDLPASRIHGIGLNCHGERLPLDKIKAIGIEWVRLDLSKGLPLDQIRSLKEYYRDFGQLWIDHQETHDAVGSARLLIEAGVTDIEVYNEPEQDHIPPASYAKTFQAVRQAVAGRARLYGPSVGTWTAAKYYVNESIDAGMRPDALSFHGYLPRSATELAEWVDDARKYGLPVVVSELGFPTYLGALPYRVSMKDSIGVLYRKTRDAMSGKPWCFYDGPNPEGDNDSGLFDWDGRAFTKPNHNYRDIVAALSKSGS